MPGGVTDLIYLAQPGIQHCLLHVEESRLNVDFELLVVVNQLIAYLIENESAQGMAIVLKTRVNHLSSLPRKQ